MRVTPYTAGPFFVLVSNPALPEDDFLVGPDGGFSTKEQAIEFVQHWEAQEESKGLTYSVLHSVPPVSFKAYMSW